jgi:succinyl-CoA:acetate CoA-transferase
MPNDRIRLNSLLGKVVSPEEAALFIKNGMTVGMSGFTRSGEAKAVPLALAERAAHEELKITLMTGANLGNDLDKILARSGVLARRLPYQSDPGLRRAINAGEVMFIDQHLSETVELLRSRQIGPVDIAVIEAVFRSIRTRSSQSSSQINSTPPQQFFPRKDGRFVPGRLDNTYCEQLYEG